MLGERRVNDVELVLARQSDETVLVDDGSHRHRNVSASTSSLPLERTAIDGLASCAQLANRPLRTVEQPRGAFFLRPLSKPAVDGRLAAIRAVVVDRQRSSPPSQD